MVTAAWIAAAVVALLWTLMLRLSVKLVGKGADNGWDNAIAYALSCGLLLIPIHYIMGWGSFFLWALVPLVAIAGQLWSLKVIYEIRLLHAAVLGFVHFIFSSLVIGATTLFAGAVAAYILKGKIIADPVWLLKIVCKLIGIDWPFCS